MSDNIPFHIQLEIIKKVTDVKSLLRFRSVSKQWLTFIDSTESITGYGARDTQPHRLLLRYIDNVNEVKYISFVDDVTFPQQQLDFAPNVSLLIKQLRHSEVIGSSCGLWCFHGCENGSSNEMLVLWNPSIRKSVGVGLHNSRGRIVTRFCFGVCPSTYDPTIVKMSYLLDRSPERKDTAKWQAEIFTLSSKTWKMIPSSNLPRESISFKFSAQVAIDRFIYWLAYDEIVANDKVYKFKRLILSFDLIAHEFKDVNLPDSFIDQLSLDVSVSKLSETLVVSAYTRDINKLVYNVWTIEDEGGDMRSCTKLLTINTLFPPSIRKLLGFSMSGEPIMETEKDDNDDFAMEVYEPCSQHINDTGIYGHKGSFFVCPYTETLLLVDHSDGCIVSSDY